MKILIIINPLTLSEVTEEELAGIRQASGGAEVIIANGRDEAAQHLPEAEIVLGIVDRQSFPKARRLKWMHSIASGADMLMYPEMVASDVVLTGEKALVGEHLADHGFALLLALTRQLKRAFAEGPDSYKSRMQMREVMIELNGLTMGIVGLGGTGRAMATRAKAFGMNVIAVDLMDDLPCPPEVQWLKGMGSFHDLLGASDVVAVCCPLTPETRGMFNDAAFDAMKPTAYIINVTRGAIIDNDSIVRALQQGKIAGAGLDVTPVEPLPPESPLWAMQNVAVTPHTAGASPQRSHRNVLRFIENLKHYRASEPLEGLIDKQKGF
jgi:phosphoglycerate dehydrogenase-like enzyme